MADFTGPLGFGVALGGKTTPPAPGNVPDGLTPLSNSQLTYIANLIAETIFANTITGITINGGNPFTDTLGRFYPVVLSAGGGLTLNTGATASYLVFHNTASVVTDLLIGLSSSGALFVSPSQAGSIGNQATFVVNDRATAGATYSGFIFYPGYTGGPLLSSNNAGVNTTIINGLTFYGLMATTASTTATAGLNVPHGTAPTSPVNGDIWTTTAGLFVRINGVTKTVTLT